jgi:hypothetical protein
MDTPPPPVESCARCGDDIGPGSPLYYDRVHADDRRVICSDCARAEQGHVTPLYPDVEVPITMPNTNLPQTH